MNCGICGGEKASPFLTVKKYELVKCQSCGLIFVANFSQSETSYSDDYFTQKNEYLNRWDEFCSIFESLIDKMLRFKKTGKLLDVGAGVGILLSVAAKKGFEVKGVEVSEWASAFARNEKGLDIITGKLEAANFKKESFDVVVINHALEHIEDPKGSLNEIYKILKEDGLLVIGVPNAGSIMAKIKGPDWASLRPEEHIWHFTPDTLKKLLKLSGFRMVYFEAKDNYPVFGWGPKAIMRRIINLISCLTNRSEAMILFAVKSGGVNNE